MEPEFKCKYEFKTKTIGAGAYGEVSIVEKNKIKFAYKKIKKDKQLKKSYFFNPIELDILFRLQSPYLVKGTEITLPKECTPEEVGLVTEFIDGNLGKDVAKLPFESRKRIMCDLALGLKCLHDNDFLHLDIKLENVMYRKEQQPRGVLIDYGLSSYAPYGVKTGILTNQPRFTFEFNSPQAIPTKDELHHYDEKHDIWALGITFLEIIADGNFTYINEDIYNKYYENKKSGNITKVYRELARYQTYYFSDNKIDSTLENFVFKYAPNDVNNKDMLKDLLKNMLRVNENLRYDINQVINHPYFVSDNLVSGRYCFTKETRIIPDLNRSIKDIGIDVDYKRGVNEIIKLAKENMKDRPCFILFMAIDIYLRFVSNLNNYSDINDRILRRFENLPYTCLLIANKYFHWGEYNTDKYIDEIEHKIPEENLIYKIINGCIREGRYFKNCKNIGEVKYVFNYFFKDDKYLHLNEYLAHEGKDFMNEHRKFVKLNEDEKDDNTFALNIEDL
jgi:serine/threonine protein kinase